MALANAGDLTQGGVGKTLLLFALPIIAGMLLQTAYNVVDAVFIGLLGPEQLAAVSLVFPVVFVFIAFASGIGAGANALVAQAVGRRDLGEANNFAEHALVLGVLFGVLIAVFGIVFSPGLFVLMGANESVLALTVEYSVPVFVGMIFMFVWFVSDSILKAEGNSRVPMRNLAVSVALNIVLDPILIFGLGPVPAMGLFGAALATVFSRVFAAALNLAYIYSPGSVLSLALRYFRPNLCCVRRMFEVGLPASVSQGFSAGGFMFLTGVVGTYGSLAIAAFGVGLRVNSVVFLPMIGISTALVSFVGQNVGSGNLERAFRVSLIARKLTFVFGVLVAVLVFLFPEQIMLVFSRDASVVAIGKGFLTVMPLAYVLYGGYYALGGAFMGVGKSYLSLATNSSYWVVAVISAFVLSGYLGLLGVWLSFVVAAVVEFALVNGVFYSRVWLRGKRLFA